MVGSLCHGLGVGLVVGGAALYLTVSRWDRGRLCHGLGVALVVQWGVVDLTIFRWGGLVAALWVGCWTCCGWGNLRFNSLQMGWLGGCVMGWVLHLLWVGEF